MTSFKLGKVSIGNNKSCFIIAEAGVNHILEKDDLERIGLNSALDVAFKMVDLAIEAKVDAIKFQSFSAKNLQFQGTQKPKYQQDNESLSESYYDLIKKYETSLNDQIEISEYCKRKGMLFISTPYDMESAEFLNDVIKVPFFKLASLELNNHLFIRRIARFGKPIILSTGLSSFGDISDTIDMARKEGFADRLILLQCTSDYPPKLDEINLNVIKTYYQQFPDMLFGFSDHTQSNIASIGAVAMGAVILEKHFTLNSDFHGPDHKASLNPRDLQIWVQEIRELELCMGSHKKALTKSEIKNMSMKKYLVVHPMKKNDIIEEKNLTAMRTGSGVLPKRSHLEKIINKKLKYDIDGKTPFKWDMVKND
jgi:sialic acid synthase SpsE